MVVLRKIKKYLIALLIPAILFLFFNNISNKHYHILSDGTVIQHAHPFKNSNSNSPFQNHKHSKTEFAFLTAINNVVTLVALALILITGTLPFIQRKYFEIKSFPKKSLYFKTLKSRAPPFYMSH